MSILKKIVIITSLLALSTSASANYLDKAPTFKDYPVEISKTKNTSISNFEGYENFETRIKNSMKSEPNAAGKYIITGWGCGGGCHEYTIINKETGKILSYELGNFADYDIDDNGMRANSKLIVLRNKDTAFFNTLENDQLTLIGTMPAIKNEDTQ